MNTDFTLSRDGATLNITLHTELSLLIGRGLMNDVVLGSPMVSRSHACLYVAEGRIWIRDLSSANGTFLNQTRILGDTAVRPGDEIALGPITFLRVSMQRRAMIA